jgi:hypothetical protein
MTAFFPCITGCRSVQSEVKNKLQKRRNNFRATLYNKAKNTIKSDWFVCPQLLYSFADIITNKPQPQRLQTARNALSVPSGLAARTPAT